MAVNACEAVLLDLLAQVRKFCEEQGEADFETGAAEAMKRQIVGMQVDDYLQRQLDKVLAAYGVDSVDPLPVIDAALANRPQRERPPQGNMTAEWPASGVAVVEETEPPEAPVHYNAAEASAWQSGWTARHLQDPSKHPDFYTWTWDVWVSGGNWRAEYGWEKPQRGPKDKRIIRNIQPLYTRPAGVGGTDAN